MTTEETIRTIDVHRGRDEVRAEYLRLALENAGIDAEVHGLRRGADVGAGEGVAEIRIMVSERDADRALQVIAEAGDEGSEAEGSPRLRRRRRLFALVASLVMPGLAQVYAGLNWSGAALLAGALARYFVLVKGSAQGLETDGWDLVGMLLAAIAMDQVLAQTAITISRAGRSVPGRAVQIILGVIQLAVLLAVAMAVRARVVAG